MQSIQRITQAPWLPEGGVVEAFITKEVPPHEKVTSVFGFVFAQDKILFTKGEDDHDHDIEIPGGHIEPNEMIEEALIRELKEETGITPETFELVAINKITVSNPPADYKYPVPDSYMLMYMCTVSKILPTNEHGIWLTLEEARNNSWVKAESGIFEAIYETYINNKK